VAAKEIQFLFGDPDAEFPVCLEALSMPLQRLGIEPQRVAVLLAVPGNPNILLVERGALTFALALKVLALLRCSGSLARRSVFCPSRTITVVLRGIPT
jgi:hypothetical protein